MKTLKLACADFTFPLLPHGRALDLIAALEMDGVDVGLFEGRSHLWPSKEFADVPRSAGALKRQLDDRGLKPADVFLQLDPDFIPYAINHPEPDRRRHTRDTFDRTIEYAARLGAPHVTTLPGVYFQETESTAESWRRSMDELAWRVGRANDAGVIFSVEAHVGSLASNPTDALRMVEAVPGLSLTLDYTHFTRLGMPDSAVEPLVRHATHFHVRGAREGRLQVNFPQNTIDYARVLAAMSETGYGGYLGIEYVWIDWEQCNESDNVSETVRFRDFLRRQFAANSASL